jgi:hypothetical protein
MDKAMVVCAVCLTNKRDLDLRLILEPWAEEITLPSCKSLRLVASSEQTGELEIEVRDDGAIVYGWPGATLSVFDGQKAIWKSYAPVPSFPPK